MVRGGVPTPAGDPAGIIGPEASLRGRARCRRAPDGNTHRRGLGRCHAHGSRPAAHRGSRRRREPVRVVAPVRGRPELGRHQRPSRSPGIPVGLRSSLRPVGDRSSASHCPSSPLGGAPLRPRGRSPLYGAECSAWFPGRTPGHSRFPGPLGVAVSPPGGCSVAVGVGPEK